MNSACTSSCTYKELIKTPYVENEGDSTISKAPRITPQRTLEYHSFSYGPSSGNSAKSASGFSSNIRENDFSSAAHEVTVGVIFRYILNAICSQYDSTRKGRGGGGAFDITSAVSRRSRHRPVFAFARKSSISRTPMLYPLQVSTVRARLYIYILSSALLTSFASSVSLQS